VRTIEKFVAIGERKGTRGFQTLSIDERPSARGGQTGLDIAESTESTRVNGGAAVGQLAASQRNADEEKACKPGLLGCHQVGE